MFYALKAGGHDTATKVVALLLEIDDLHHAPADLCMRNDGYWMSVAA